MSDPFLAEIRIFSFDFAPTGWAICDGALLSLRQNTALFALLGTNYGGDGKNTFGLPDLRGRAPMFWGQGPGLSDYYPGQNGGSETVTLDASHMPAHAHQLQHAGAAAAYAAPGDSVLLADAAPAQIYSAATGADVVAPALALNPAGGSMPHNNMQPYLTLNFCICLQGTFPPRS
ncbi:phage tail protein [Rugamonas sp. CCM 8940]|uniref:phage tail protein n=1 Tax=Rugamonas sp. CCM 8940 TaxID=2765359 RepID=UPI0018F37FAE|nr:tail fiber protein [Rugamonas sp. CCM 8940]MBJ7309367.1 phage tail protein [Rugamonas sp. CCM 8940]